MNDKCQIIDLEVSYLRYNPDTRPPGEMSNGIDIVKGITANSTLIRKQTSNLHSGRKLEICHSEIISNITIQ